VKDVVGYQHDLNPWLAGLYPGKAGTDAPCYKIRQPSKGRTIGLAGREGGIVHQFWGFVFRVSGFGLLVSDLKFRVSGFGFRVQKEGGRIDLREKRRVDVERPEARNSQEGLGEELSVGRRDAQVRRDSTQLLQELCGAWGGCSASVSRGSVALDTKRRRVGRMVGEAGVGSAWGLPSFFLRSPAGVRTGMPASSPARCTGDDWSCFLRPCFAGGFEMTALISKGASKLLDAAIKARSDCAATSGVPRKTTFCFPPAAALSVERNTPRRRRPAPNVRTPRVVPRVRRHV